MNIKLCATCGIVRDITAFSKDKYRKDGISNRCKECDSAKFKVWAIKEKEYFRLTSEIFEKQCSGCKKFKPSKSFNKDKSRVDGLQRYCKVCQSASARKNKTAEKSRRTRVQKEYGITPEDAAILLRKQNGKCAISGVELEYPSQNAHIDHDHDTKEIRGILSYKSNAMLGFGDDDPRNFMNAVIYLCKGKVS